MYVIIIGCGRVGSQLARLLSSEGHNVVVIDKSNESFASLGKKFNGVTRLGNGFDSKVLQDAGIQKAQAVCCVTDNDNVNIVASQMAKKVFQVPKVLARINDPHRAEVFQSLGLNVISGTVLLAAMMRDKLVEEHFSSYLLEASGIGMLEVEVGDTLQGNKVQDITIPSEYMIATIIRRNKPPIIPGPETVLERGDKFIAVVKTASLQKIRKTLALDAE